jgi:plastocyanin
MADQERTLHVRFEIDGTDIIYRPAVLHARVTDKVEWHFDDGLFAVAFPDRTPFEAPEFDTFNPRGTVIGAPGRYSYSVALVPGQRPDATTLVNVKRVLLDAGCPEIIIQR